ncbi:DUF2023 family protein [Xanthobacter oligotrophicus]|uniref:DUF2023 family protein n=1 Tax=Xanthobacter oligotrophicus TaxID=2607286 RepID=A0ABW7A088_9HYPH
MAQQAALGPGMDSPEDASLAEEALWPPSPVAAVAEGCAAPVMRLFQHHVYEYGRGVRALFLMTLCRAELPLVLARLGRHGIDHFVQEVSPVKVNLFFGRPAFVAVAQAVVTRPLNTLTAEEDFMLGTLLGYDKEQQCRRYLGRSGRGQPEAVALAAE